MGVPRSVCCIERAHFAAEGLECASCASKMLPLKSGVTAVTEAHDRKDVSAKGVREGAGVAHHPHCQLDLKAGAKDC